MRPIRAGRDHDERAHTDWALLQGGPRHPERDRKSTRLNSSHQIISYAVFCLKKNSLVFDTTPGSGCGLGARRSDAFVRRQFSTEESPPAAFDIIQRDCTHPVPVFGSWSQIWF